MQRLAERRKTLKRLETALESEDDTVFLKAFAEVANRAFGRATEKVEHEGDITVRVIRDDAPAE